MSIQIKKRTKKEGTNHIQQYDEYLSVLKRFGIPTSDSDTLEATENLPFTLIYNTTLNKLRIFDGVIWKDAALSDLTNYYTKTEIDLLFSTKVNGLKLEVNQTNAEVYLKDSDNNVLSVINVGFLNNEGTTFVYNEIDNTLELYNDSEELLTAIPVSSFLTNTVSQILFNGTSPTFIELKDVNGVLISTVQIKTINIDGLEEALNDKEPLITILPVNKGGTGKSSINENNFYVGGPGNTLTEKTIQEVFDLLIKTGNGLDTDLLNNIYVVSSNTGRITVNPSGIDLAQVAVVPGTYYKVTIDNYGRVVGTDNVNISDFSTILASIDSLNVDGFLVKNGENVVSRIITGTTGRITVTNQTGVNGNPIIDLSPVGIIPGTYNSVIVDDYGRVIYGSQIDGISKHSELTLDDGTNPHNTTKIDVGLGNVDNTSDVDKPISILQQNEFNNKLDLRMSQLVSDLSITEQTEIKNKLKIIEDKSYTHVQSTPSDEWLCIHNLDKKVSVTVTDSSGSLIEGAVTVMDNNTVQLKFTNAFWGYAHFN